MKKIRFEFINWLRISVFFFWSGLNPYKAEQPLQGMELHIKEKEKDKNLIGKMFIKEKRCLLALDFKPFRS